MSARLLSAFGEQRDRFTSAQQLQQYAGIAPVTERSGKKSWGSCPPWGHHRSEWLYFRLCLSKQNGDKVKQRG